MSKVYITDSSFASNEIEMTTLQENGHECVLLGTRDPAEIARRAADAEALLVQFAPINDQVLEAMPGLKVMVRYGIGVDNFDLAVVRRHGAVACNCPGYCLEEVADHTLAFILASARKLPQVGGNTRAGRWTVGEGKSPIMSLGGKTLGFIGFGAIGKQVASRALAFGMRLIAYDPYLSESDAERHQVERVPLDALWGRSDFITLHCPLTEETRHVVDRDAFARMKPGVILINNGRGGLVDEAALLDALNAGQVAMAALDVLEVEPPREDYPLLSHPNVLVTPHVASVSEHSSARLQQMAVDEVVRVLSGRPAAHPVGGTGSA